MSNFSYDLIKKGLDMSSLRQRTVSSNIANINTPDYKVNKVQFEDLLKTAIDENAVTLEKSHPNHFGIGEVEDIEPIVKKRESTSLNDNGNNVDVDLEMTELAANELYYNTLVSQLNSRLANLNYVINK
ncbi:flagellar basal-body rod protein FlgB [Alkalibaculum bacchi]|uniref:Flagellar basal body rod protein FlgB n=1 Tax=Alkalibaculum bacchi TaxID=645887 RepID=A0A366IFI2_9FIRM|nr:flagellar basal body rod protein FlgB [Alkalibaculum bacchi]RBP70111.1 flagellar basal-body rod protein FlgB [Alkalibaculum bacchi]